MSLFKISILLVSLLIATACQKPSKSEPDKTAISLSRSDEALLNRLQAETFQYFWENAEPVSGLAPERTHMDNIYPLDDKNVVTSGGSGFGLMALVVGVERGFITRNDMVGRLEKNLDFLETADRFHGVYPHWWYGDTGKVKPFSKRDDGGDLVETAFLVQGLLTVRQYLDGNDEREKDIIDRINDIWYDVEWSWHTQGGKDVLYWHWSPNFGWEMNFPVGGYNECLIMYVLAASSPTHGIDASVYHEGWARNRSLSTDLNYLGHDVIVDHFDTDDSPVGPLFWAHYSYLGLDPRNLTDDYGDYWEVNRNHVLIHYTYCVTNPNGFEGYGETNWGLTSSYSMKGYSGHRPDRDLGVISPTAALSSIPYTPEESMQMILWLYEPEQEYLIGKYGPYDAFSREHDWYLPRYLAIDQGPIVLMVENFRTGLLWDLFMSAPEIQIGLDKLGFEVGE